MTGLLYSTIFDWLLLSSLIAVAAPLTAWLICVTKGRHSAVIRHHAWMWALLAVAVIPLLRVTVPKFDIPILPDRIEAHAVEDSKTHQAAMESRSPSASGVEEKTNRSNASASASPPREASVPTRFGWLTILWALGIVFMLLRLARSGMQLHDICRRAVDDVSTTLPPTGIAKGVFISDDIEIPMVCGLHAPVILLPRGLYETTDVDTLKMVIRHELAHIARGDHRTVIFQRLLEALLFFHPFIWLASRELTREREHICDLHAVREGVPARYAKLLSTLLRKQRTSRWSHVPALIEGGARQTNRAAFLPKD